MLEDRVEFVSSSVGHRLVQGLANEDAVSELLEDSLPANVGVGSGVIVGTGGEFSKQVDVVLYDVNRGNPMLSPITQLFVADQVFAGVEVKTTYTRSALREALANIASVKRLSVVPRPWEEWEPDGSGGVAPTQYVGRPPLGVILFLRADLPDGPVDLDALFAAWESELSAIPLADQPDLILSASHASLFRHTDIGAHSDASKQFSVAFLQDPTTHDPMSIDAAGTPGAIVELGDPGLGIGDPEVVPIANAAGTREVLVAKPDSFGRVRSHKVASGRGGLYVLDPGRAMLGALASLEVLVRLKRLNPSWSPADYFGVEFGLTSVYPDDLPA